MTNADTAIGPAATSLDALFDPADYRQYLADIEIGEEQAAELLRTLWSIMIGMSELGFAHDVCGQILESLDGDRLPAPGNVESSAMRGDE